MGKREGKGVKERGVDEYRKRERGVEEDRQK